jgi:predicted dienelactone hydrolase
MPKHGGLTIEQLLVRHQEAVDFIAEGSDTPIGVYGEGLGGYVAFYLALSGARSTASRARTPRPS